MQTGDSAATDAARNFARDWHAVRVDSDIQFAPVEMPKPPQTPAWLQAIYDFIGDVLEAISQPFVEFGKALGLSATVVLWILGVIVAALLALLIWRMIAPTAGPRRKPEAAGQEWAPDAAQAQVLLEDADRLATQGRYAEATHLLLQRSVLQIRRARPDLLEPSSTAREISVLPALPESARRAFATIAERVEMSLFALRMLSAEDWQAARAAYANFALSAIGSPEESGA